MSPKPDTTYECAECHKPVKIKRGTAVRSCDCPADTCIVANIMATAYGESRVADSKGDAA